MMSLGLMFVVALVVAIVALTGVKLKGARPVARTGLMIAARIVLVILVAVVVYVVWGRS
jgi:hypothetical protein